MDRMAQMRSILMLSAASALALGLVTSHAATLSPGVDAVAPDGLVQKVQRGDDKGLGGRGEEGGAKRATPGARDGGGKGGGPGSAQEKSGDRGAAPEKGDRGAGMRPGEKGTRGAQRGSDVHRGTRGERGRAAGRTDIDIDARGRRADRDRGDRRTRIDIDVDRGRRARGRDGDVYPRGYGYRSGSCEDLLRRYRQCRAR